MTMGNNVTIKDRLIKKTTDKKSTANIKSKENNASNVITTINGKNKNATKNTKKATFYIKSELLQKLYNFSYWERYNITEAINIALADGLKEKNTKSKETI